MKKGNPYQSEISSLTQTNSELYNLIKNYGETSPEVNQYLTRQNTISNIVQIRQNLDQIRAKFGESSNQEKEYLQQLGLYELLTAPIEKLLPEPIKSIHSKMQKDAKILATLKEIYGSEAVDQYFTHL